MHVNECRPVHSERVPTDLFRLLHESEANINKMAASINDKSHKCCPAAMCNNRSDNRNDLIFHNFPLHESQRKIWEARMKRADEKFASSTSLLCCSEHFTEKDYRKSTTSKRHDLVKDAVPSVFPWSLSVDRDKECEKSERAKVREGKDFYNQLRAHRRK